MAEVNVDGFPVRPAGQGPPKPQPAITHNFNPELLNLVNVERNEYVVRQKTLPDMSYCMSVLSCDFSTFNLRF